MIYVAIVFAPVLRVVGVVVVVGRGTGEEKPGRVVSFCPGGEGEKNVITPAVTRAGNLYTAERVARRGETFVSFGGRTTHCADSVFVVSRARRRGAINN